ncbi:AAA family ATPase [Spirosoma sp. KNUC1025]|uniref:AAA family ATPase n=1 Tax=Spirosoma sp. KNUC1025 TaxID=2894082 RepID=UPI0038653D94|nr:ATP-binding protein [Spirosoma sp. KNUC1025]
MIHVKLDSKFKSLLTSLNIYLPDFTIISGINGAGKSHLLNAIEQGTAKVFDENGTELTQKKYVNSGSLTPNDAYSVGRDYQINEINNAYNSIQSYITTRKTTSNITLESHLQYNPNQVAIIKKIATDAGKDVAELTIEDINEFYPLVYGTVSDIFYQNFSVIFKRYHDKYEDNLYYEYLKEKKGKNKKYLTEDDFLKKYGPPPWEVVNRIFEEAEIDYTINDPIENDRDIPFTFRLINKANNAIINFTDLSSGEKVLMSLALSLYNAKFDIDFPKLLLLDEPDAPLHPSMAKQLLRVIQEVFVKEKGVKVIMTTHSPSTIAMAPDEALFIMQKQEPRFIKKSKDQIMKLLTDGIPSFSIYADDRRQVFVESSVDADFYTKIYGKLKKVIQSDKSLYFISSGVTKNNTGNCDQVKEIVKLLSTNGNQTVYGIIDWDKKNVSTNRIFVLGQNMRYSIENYIFDPIILANFILREKIKSRSYFTLEEEDQHFNFPNFPPTKLQAIANKLVDDISKNISSTDSGITVVYYQGNLSLQIPTWYLHHQGHDLETIIKQTYPELNQYGKLKEQIVKKVIDDLPEFISLDIVNLLQALHN